MNAQQIIQKFETQVDDLTELSSSDELDLLNKVYNDVWNDRPWQFSKKGFSGAINGTTIALPADFSYIFGSDEKTYIRVDGVEYELIKWDDRNTYNFDCCWVDIVGQTLTFSKSVSGTCTYDYIYFPEELIISDSPIFPSAFHPVLYHLMASEDYIIQQSDKAKSYQAENQAQANKWLSKLRYWNANL